MSKNDRLTQFIFLLIRDYIPTGAIAQMILKINDLADDEVIYTNEYLKALSEDYAKRIIEG